MCTINYNNSQFEYVILPRDDKLKVDMALTRITYLIINAQ